jgi:hypothetical protein
MYVPDADRTFTELVAQREPLDAMTARITPQLG